MVFSIKKDILFKILLLKAWAICLFGLVFSIFYLTSTYNGLVKWFLSLNDCFYRNTHWTTEIFNATTKSQGNLFCIGGIVISIAGIILLLFVKRKSFHNPLLTYKIESQDIYYAAGLLLICLSLWIYGNFKILPAYDEVFSAVNCAGIHPFQTVSYYMLPNNHIGFNLLNGILFHFVENKVITGRLISLVAFWGIAVMLYAIFRKYIQYRIFSALGVITVLLVLPVWGFSFQARGYELYALAELALFISVIMYTEQQNNKWLYLNAIAGVIGYFLIPTFLYMHAAQLVFMVFYQILNRKFFKGYWLAQIVCFSIVYLLYLAALCFSGLHMLLENPYVSPGGDTNWILSHAFPYLREYATYCFSAVFSEYHWMNNALFLLPLLIFLFLKRRDARLIGFFYVIMWCVLYAVVIKMRKFPFMRNSIGHEALTMTFFVITLYWIFYFISEKLKKKVFLYVFFTASLAVLWFHLWMINSEWIGERVYNYKVNDRNMIVVDGLANIPKGATIGFSDESFYWYYIYRSYGHKISECLIGNEDFMIKQNDEPFPLPTVGKYNLIKTTEIYEIYKRKE